MDSILLMTTLLALYGAYLNSKGDWRGFAIWMATNTIFLINNLMIEQWCQALLFGSYLALSANGLYNSKIKD